MSKTRRRRRGDKIQIHSFLFSALDIFERLKSLPDRFTAGEGTVKPFNWRLGGPQDGSPMFWRRGEILDLTGIRTADLPAHSLVMTLSTLPRLPIKINLLNYLLIYIIIYLLTYLLTYSIQQSPSLEANRSSAS